ncbi:MAG: TolC family protein [Myxococcota bacterium]
MNVVLGLLLAAAPLRLEQAVTEALKRNETYAIAQARQAQAAADLRAAWAELLPSADLTGSYTRRRLRAPPEGSDQDILIRANNALNARISAQTRLFEASQLPSIGAAQDDVEAEGYRTELEVRNFAFDVATAFLQVVGLERTQAAAVERLELAESILDEVRKRAEAGLTSSNDVSRSQLEVASARLALTEADNDVVQARLQLGFLMGRPLLEELDPPQMDALTEAQDVDSFVDEAMTQRPDVAVLATEFEAARRRAVEPWLRLVPSLRGEAEFTFTNETGFQEREFNYNLSLIAAWPIYDAGLRHADARRTRARLEELALELRQLRRAVEVGIRSALAERRRAEAAVVQAEAQVQAAEVNAGEVGQRFRAGLATALEQADANVQLFSARARLEASRFELGQAELSVLEARGGVPPGYALPSEGLAADG